MADPFEEYFRGYAASFERRDAYAIAAFYLCPCLMVNKDSVATFSTREAILNNMRGLVGVDGDQSPQRFSASEFRVEYQSENLANVCLRWSMVDDQDQVLSSWLNTYQLVDYGLGWKVLVSTTHA